MTIVLARFCIAHSTRNEKKKYEEGNLTEPGPVKLGGHDRVGSVSYKSRSDDQFTGFRRVVSRMISNSVPGWVVKTFWPLKKKR